jgi:hypothetical protein
MTFRQGLLAARGSIIMALGFATAFMLIATLERWKPASAAIVVEASGSIPAPPSRPLTERERQWAEIAWRYFERNLRPETGLVDSADRYPSATLWDTGSYLMALIAAERLSLIPRDTFDHRMSQALASLTRLTLFDGDAPNKAYSTTTLEMIDYNHHETPRGIGWSAIDIGRLLVPLHTLVWDYPSHSGEVRDLLRRWHWQKLVQDGLLIGAALDAAGHTTYVQEGRLGYEEYGAKAFALTGLNVERAQRVDDFLRFVNAYGVRVATDSRTPEASHAHSYVVSEPYVLDGIEFGWDDTSRELAYRVAQAQEARWRATGLLTAVSEDNIDQPPYFVYNTIVSDGRLWQTITPDGADAAAFKSISTKAAIAWHMLYETDYTTRLVDRIDRLYDPSRGWYSGLYERTGTPNTAISANTNAIVLESLCYKRYGPLLRVY